MTNQTRHPATGALGTHASLNHGISRRSFLKLLGAGALLAPLALAGCGGSAQGGSGPASTESANHVRLAFSGESGSQYLIDSGAIAQRENFLQEELDKVGYSFDITGFTGGPSVNEALTSNAIDVVVYGDLPGYVARAQGIDTRAFAVANSQLNCGILATAASGATSTADLRGKKVVVGTGTVLQEYFLDELAAAGVDPGEVQQINALNDGPSMLSSGQADALVSTLPPLFLYEGKGLGSVIANSATNPGIATMSLFYGQSEFLDKNPDAIKAIVRALKRGQEFAAQNPDKAWEDLSTNSMSKGVEQKAYADATFASFSPKIDDKVRARFENIAKFATDNKLVNGTVDLDTFLDAPFYEE